jgi:hypothetical protein
MSDVLLLAFPDPFDHGIHREPSVEEVIEWLRGRGHIHDLSHNAGKGLLICHRGQLWKQPKADACIAVGSSRYQWNSIIPRPSVWRCLMSERRCNSVYLGVRCVLHRGHDGRRCRWFRSQPTHQFVEWIDPQRTGKASLLD